MNLQIDKERGTPSPSSLKKQKTFLDPPDSPKRRKSLMMNQKRRMQTEANEKFDLSKIVKDQKDFFSRNNVEDKFKKMTPG